MKLLPQLGPSPGIILHKYFMYNKLINILVFRVLQSSQLVKLTKVFVTLPIYLADTGLVIGIFVSSEFVPSM